MTHEPLARYQARFAEIYPRFLPQNDRHIGEVYRAVHYSFSAGGKRLRPALAYALADSLGIDLNKIDAVAMAVECIHTYSLIHDDLPDMDNDDLRRGKPACHTQFNAATAILAGDALNTLAFEILAVEDSTTAVSRLRQIHALASGAGIAGMVGGQDTDLTCENQGYPTDINVLSDLHRRKTAKLIEACLLMTYFAADTVSAEKTALLSNAALSLGLLYQIQDDILDVTQTSKVLGKPADSDSGNDKVTYVSLLGLKEAQRIADNTAARLQNELHDFFAPNINYVDTPLANVIAKIKNRKK